MANIFINRNRSQGSYGKPIYKQQSLDLNQTWQARSRKDPNEFLSKSIKYGTNLDL